MDVLDGKSEEEIRRAATWWFTAKECYPRGDKVPESVWLISTGGGTQSDIEWAQKLIAEHPEWEERSTEDGVIDDGFGNAWSITCPECQRPSMQIVRPGKAQCGYCG